MEVWDAYAINDKSGKKETTGFPYPREGHCEGHREGHLADCALTNASIEDAPRLPHGHQRRWGALLYASISIVTPDSIMIRKQSESICWRCWPSSEMKVS